MRLDEFAQYVGFTTEDIYEMDEDRGGVETMVETKGFISFYEIT